MLCNTRAHAHRVHALKQQRAACSLYWPTIHSAVLCLQLTLPPLLALWHVVLLYSAAPPADDEEPRLGGSMLRDTDAAVDHVIVAGGDLADVMHPERVEKIKKVRVYVCE